MEMGKKIHELRMQKGMTLEELGNIVGVGKSTVRKWENGIIANMKRDKILKVSVALGVSPAYLMGWEESTDEEIISLNNVHPIELKRFPMLGEIACGVPKYTNEDRESYVMAGTNINADFCLRASPRGIKKEIYSLGIRATTVVQYTQKYCRSLDILPLDFG